MRIEAIICEHDADAVPGSNIAFVPGGDAVPRSEMPQIKSDPAEREKFFEYLRSQRIDVLDGMKPVARLMPTQGEFNVDKIDSLMADFQPEKNPVLVSSDAKLLDGHHRWAAAMNLKLDEMAVQVLDLELDAALDVMRAYPEVFYKGVDESRAGNDKEKSL